MNRVFSHCGGGQKERSRQEIETQVREFLARGGKIEVITGSEKFGKVVGNLWHGHDDPMKLLP